MAHLAAERRLSLTLRIETGGAGGIRTLDTPLERITV